MEQPKAAGRLDEVANSGSERGTTTKTENVAEEDAPAPAPEVNENNPPRQANCRSVMRSSLDVPFIVVSELCLVEDLPPLPAEHFQDLLHALNGIVDELEAERAILLADFEGEMTGFGGELVTAAFLPTTTLERDGFRVGSKALSSLRHPDEPRAGLLLDLRCEAGRRLVRRIMQSEDVCKVIWGADGDLTSLRHQVLPAPLQISSRAVIDAQLAFSQPHARLGMARMLERVPRQLLEHLPDKACVEFDLPHSINRRALRWPLQCHEARYAADDLHRLEAILQSQVPPSGGYGSAMILTAEIMSRIEHDPFGLAWLGNELNFFSRKPPGTQRRAKAVQLVRHIKTLPARMMAYPVAFPPWVAGLEASLVAELASEGVFIPNDVSFASDPVVGTPPPR
jgi:hypothetical protein|mmetsp:Transcript_77084/g.121739  ORF Transcript_77084/g.121739 Transcript_77084/m.121739 type:complete len:397 (-) Transcript_77084:48-1238(-)